MACMFNINGYESTISIIYFFKQVQLNSKALLHVSIYVAYSDIKSNVFNCSSNHIIQ